MDNKINNKCNSDNGQNCVGHTGNNRRGVSYSGVSDVKQMLKARWL